MLYVYRQPIWSSSVDLVLCTMGLLSSLNILSLHSPRFHEKHIAFDKIFESRKLHQLTFVAVVQKLHRVWSTFTSVSRNFADVKFFIHCYFTAQNKNKTQIENKIASSMPALVFTQSQTSCPNKSFSASYCAIASQTHPANFI